jgi:hypothetical protein
VANAASRFDTVRVDHSMARNEPLVLLQRHQGHPHSEGLALSGSIEPAASSPSFVYGGGLCHE